MRIKEAIKPPITFVPKENIRVHRIERDKLNRTKYTGLDKLKGKKKNNEG